MSPKKPKTSPRPLRPMRVAVPVARAPRLPPSVSQPVVAPIVRPTSDATAIAEALVADVTMRRKRIAEDFYEIGVALERLSNKDLYRSLGYANFDALLAGRRLMSRVQATKLIAVAQAYSKKLALRLGVEKGYALVRYTATTPASDVARILAKTNATIGGKRVHTMSVAELREQTKRLTAPPSPSDADTQAARRVARALQRDLRKKGAASATVRAERQGAKWKLRVEVDLEEAEVLRQE